MFLSKKPDSFRLFDRRHLPELRQYWLGDDPIHVNHGNGFARFRIPRPASQREISNIDFVIAQDRAYLPDHARDVTIAKVNKVALERSFHFNSIHVQQAWGILVQHSALDDVLFRLSFHTYGKHAPRSSGRTLGLAVLMNA